MNQPALPQNSYDLRVRATVIQLFCWSGAWGVTCALLALGPKFLWNKALAFTLLAIAINVCVGIGAIMSHKKYFDELDELQRKIHFNSLAITVGVAMITGVPYSLLDLYHVIPFHADISYLIVLMTFTYAASNLYGTRRYR